ncbi:outer membrane protein [Bartonella schoenbuchensis]|uniref:Outer membrane protein beta-barrel domain-containing protein n=2 Tax=Bartonella schoenbuchensis (strain DSM 13525 / NCTC 13165 / R1) TaxID=687861 RepID=E6YZE4_BARSR|nr:outer membrane protein [Bartonella schoenbuchensis]AQX30735.1 Outer membrane protein beta-barrel domain-containing protein [Bartonella schoenbuchensis R1]CBI82232.1 putative Hemin-binding protein B [Bartonella schoenbuchensis R1]CBI82271.1 putative Hemin-binding protein B [Bartonella schoenbuchensis R1]
MNTKCLISTSIITLFTASVAQAADIMVPRESRPVVSPPQASKQISPPVEMSPNSDIPPVISAPTFSWNGFYLGGQIGGFSGKTGISLYAKKGPSTREWTPVEKDTVPQLSGFMGGLYAGANVDLGNSFILGVDTDIVWSNKQDTKIVAKRKFEELELEEIEEVEEIEEGPDTESERRQLYEYASASRLESMNHSPSQGYHASSASSAEHGYSSSGRVERSTIRRTKRANNESSSFSQSFQLTQVQQRSTSEAGSQSSGATQADSSSAAQEQVSQQQVAQQRGSEARPSVSGYPHSNRSALSARRYIRETEEVDEIAEVTKVYSNTLKQKWSGATRVRIGFAVDRIVPYIAGGVAYAQLQNIFSRSIETEGHEISSSSLSDKKIMVGYTLGGGVDFAMADNVILRAEYRYSDFGKQKFAKDKLELDYQTNDFRVGVAYKF